MLIPEILNKIEFRLRKAGCDSSAYHLVYKLLDRQVANQKEIDILLSVFMDCRIIYEFKGNFRDFLCELYPRYKSKSYRKALKKSSYRRKEGHSKKELSEHEIHKREWRKKKKFKDERSKKNHFDYQEYNREYNASSLRKWAKVRLKKGDYDLEVGWKGDKHFNTEWVW